MSRATTPGSRVRGEDGAESDSPASGVPARADRYAVVGNPVAHSLSPEIHAAFAVQAGVSIDYRRIVAPLDGFVATVERFFADGGRGLNVTLPFKLDAHALCGARVTARAARAGAVNCIARDEHGLVGDNTDGAGLVADLRRIVDDAGRSLDGLRILLIGAGGAARGVLGALLDEKPQSLTIVNRTSRKADALVATFADARETALRSCGFDALDGPCFDLIVNATSSSLAGDDLPLPRPVFAAAQLAYDLMYGRAPTPFMDAASRGGTTAVCDGLGMLVEQAAESYQVWRGVRPVTAPVLERLRRTIASP